MEQTILISMPIGELQSVIIDCVTACLLNNKPASTPQTAPKSEGFITEDEASKLIGGKNGKLSKVSMWKLRKNNVIQGYRVGRGVRYKTSEIMDSLSKINPKK